MYSLWALDVILRPLLACPGSDKSVLLMNMRITLRIVHFDAQISDGTIAFPSEHKTKLVRNHSVPV